MTSSHNLALAPQSALSELTRYLESRQGAAPVGDLEKFERDIHAMCAAVEREAVAEELAKLDVDVPVIEVEGVTHRRVLRCEETYFGAAGHLRVMRSQYSTREDGERAICPLELRAGIVEGRWTPLAAKQATWAVAHLTPQESEKLFEMLGGMTPSKSSLDRLPKQLSARWEENRRRFEGQLRASQSIPESATTVAVSLDGVLVPTMDGQRLEKRAQAENEGKETRGPAGYKEAGCATLSFYNAEGDRLSTVRMARMPEPKKVTLKSMLTAELAVVLEARPDLKIVKVADGARDNWTYLRELPEGVEVVDFYHAAEHLSAAVKAAYGETSTKGRSQFEKLRHVLRHDVTGAEKIIRSLRHLRDRHPRSGKLAKEVRYFVCFRQRCKAPPGGVPTAGRAGRPSRRQRGRRAD